MLDVMDLHTHTIASGHAYNTFQEMAKAASEKGLALLGFADHGPEMPGSASRIYFDNFRALPREMYGVKLMFGCELNILDHQGNVDLLEKQLRKQDFTVASFHGTCYPGGTVAQNTGAYLAVLENPYVTVIGHPDDAAFPVDYETLVPAAKEAGKLLEMNSRSMHPASVRGGARENYLKMLEVCRRLEQPILLGSDAHFAGDVGDHSIAWDLLREVDFPEHLIVNGSLESAARYLPFLARLLQGKVTEKEMHV